MNKEYYDLMSEEMKGMLKSSKMKFTVDYKQKYPIELNINGTNISFTKRSAIQLNIRLNDALNEYFLQEAINETQ